MAGSGQGLNALDVLAKARNLGYQGNLAGVQTAIGSVDQASIRAQHRARYVVEVWDGVSPLGGLPAEYWHVRPDFVPGGAVYLIYRDGQLLLVQPHAPEAGMTPMDAASALQRGNSHADDMAGRDADEEATDQALQTLL